MTRISGLITAGFASLLLTTTPTAATAATTVFGANVDAVPAANGLTCGQLPPGLFYPINSPSCMWSDLGLTPPATGRVTAVRVKVGPTTGPMRVNVVRYLFRQTGDTAHPFSAGPFLEAYGPEFTPAANATTTVPANLAVTEDPTPALTDLQTIQVIDVLALEVESGVVPIPMVQSNLNTSVGVYPGPTAGGVPAPSPAGIPGSYLTFGYSVMMNADLTTDDAGGGGGGGGGTTAVPTIALPNRTAKVRDGVARIPIECRVADCTGLIDLIKTTGKAAATSKTKTVGYGKARFSLKAGKKLAARVKLNRAGRSLIRRHRTAKVTAKVTFTRGGGTTKRFSLTLRR